MQFSSKLVCFFCLLFVSSFNLAFSFQKSDSKAFYALSSLCFHLESVISDDSQEEIFSNEDLCTLWDSAMASECQQEVLAGKDLYYSALEQSPLDSKSLLTESKRLLEEAWKRLNPLLHNPYGLVEKKRHQADYILPDDSPLQAPLKKIFSKRDVLGTPKNFTDAGFKLVSVRSSGMFVASHSTLKGHLVKAYTESRRLMPNWEWAVIRCSAADSIQALIDEKGLRHYVVPNKWIYPVTTLKHLKENLAEMTDPMVLVVTDMNIVKKKNSVKAWKSKVTKRHLEELYCILSHGYGSGALPSNIPYTKEGKFACVDTELLRPNFSYYQANRYFSDEMLAYWKYLVKTGGKSLSF